ncbi:replication regulatory RepB family protein [Helicobacter pylori]|uniref:replication regulatory RepB family protein n=1 Tax=Helicobacter pylori TaxID=210 RepID=UPI000EB54B8B|nr:replication regulatory RepB family protein [Helicobacter pylori]RKU99929.1 replication regulatory RepB family protein [Helicobacter pylori]
MKKYQNKRKLGKRINCFISNECKDILENYLKVKKLSVTQCIENLVLGLDPSKETLKAKEFYESLFKVISINQHVYRELIANSNNLNQLTKNTNIAIKYNKPFYLQNLAFLEEIFKVMDTLNKNVEECKKISLELLLQIYKEQKSQTEFNTISKILNALNEKQSTTEPKKDNA